MKPPKTFTYEFVEFIPDAIEEGKIYVSIDYATVVHTCACGCGKEVVTPLSPTDWKLVFDGKTVSLDPSIGNWGFPCRSHYWVKNNRALWAEDWSQSRIDANRAHDRRAKRICFTGIEKMGKTPELPPANQKEPLAPISVKDHWWKRFWPWR
jgi:hypothetical protein